MTATKQHLSGHFFLDTWVFKVHTHYGRDKIAGYAADSFTHIMRIHQLNATKLMPSSNLLKKLFLKVEAASKIDIKHGWLSVNSLK